MDTDHLNIPNRITSKSTNQIEEPAYPPESIVLMMVCADGISIHRWDKNKLEKRINILYQVFQKIGLNINFFKTKTYHLELERNH